MGYVKRQAHCESGDIKMNFRIIPIKTVETPEMGMLSFFEAEKTIEFPIRRIYYIHGVHQGVERGAHAHRTLKEFLFCPYGKILIRLDDGYEKKEILLDSPMTGLVLYPGLWRDMLWLQDNSVLCVAASEYYDPDDYIRDYEQFLLFSH